MWYPLLLPRRRNIRMWEVLWFYCIYAFPLMICFYLKHSRYSLRCYVIPIPRNWDLSSCSPSLWESNWNSVLPPYPVYYVLPNTRVRDTRWFYHLRILFVSNHFLPPKRSVQYYHCLTWHNFFWVQGCRDRSIISLNLYNAHIELPWC